MMGIVDRMKRVLQGPRGVVAAIAIGGAGLVLGLAFAGGFATFVQYSNTMEFCVSCHEMESTVYEEYKESAHWNSRSGIRPRCADCHVPHDDWVEMVVFKIGATQELYHKAVGTVDTVEEFEARRLELAQRVWDRMEATDSKACRFCHKTDAWDLEQQQRRAQVQHADMAASGDTCIDCHKGIAHKAVHEQLKEEEEESFQPFGTE